ncbi:hypothetical protein AGABI2DRAFT_120893 [Agaricus bisporus var. bisporus H97]|uniref:hypothetical protein n=1 Tax=Agaricus bisporus var. bisporus (strain H97 / ATCC MYA-4626 / FGSC 10389) TaxID=936046 RepID=UPI00029F70DC|nr:hypothetical protein AGABI2DRAFT_120893 [Agaricus bisporus var. bisporus H97]EKV44790.1 hypothetical protein AGABI2DRAFT_120893 [Agaricus bisporus var. bisporus H97]
MTKLFLSFPQFLRCGRSRSPKSPKANSSHATGVYASSRPSSEHGQGGPVTAAPNISNDSAGRFDPESQFISSIVEPNSAQTPTTSRSVDLPAINPVPPSKTTDSDPLQQEALLVVPGRSPATASQTSLLSQQSTPTPRQDGHLATIYVLSTHESRNVSVRGDGNNVNYSTTVFNNSNKFMAELLENTIPGAAFNSSARDPPPRCHPGTRLAILARCLEFIANAIDERKMRWVVGAAGVGKSAILQSVIESPLPSMSNRVSIFFSINGRNDGTKTIVTLAYQIAAKCEPYRQIIEHEITCDPSLLQSSLSVQFEKFIVEPIIHRSLPSSDRILIAIDGLDECDKSDTQLELLRLISLACAAHPSSPIVWIVSSRPEPHITPFFAQDHVRAVCKKEVILVDSDEAREDVEKFLRDELTKIRKEFSLNPRSQWPSEQDFWKLANASGGLFVFADTAIKYIGDRVSGNPKSQLNDVLKAIDAHPLPDVPQEEHPMARLDALYAQIFSKIPKRVMANTRKILLALTWDSKAILHTRKKENFLVFCNSLGMTYEDVYAAIRHLSAVLDAPSRDEAHKKCLQSFHKSFVDYISDFTRSGFSPGIDREAYLLEVQNAFRILEQAPGDIDSGHVDDFNESSVTFGRVAHGRSISGNISLAWPIDDEIDWNDAKTRLEMYKWAISLVVEGIQKGESAFCTESCIRLVTSRFEHYDHFTFPYQELERLESPRRPELIKHGILKQVPVKVLDLTKVSEYVRLRFRRPTVTATDLSHSWDPSCKHERAGNWEEGNTEDWETKFPVDTWDASSCHACHTRLERQLEDWKSRHPDHPTIILFTSANRSFVEFQFIDPDDGVSEWTHWLVYEFSQYEGRKLGSTV